MVLVRLRDCGGLGGALEWSEVKRLDPYFVLQKLRPISLIGKMQNKPFRILLVHTQALLQNKKPEGAGKRFIAAEADKQEEILLDWNMLEKYAFPVLQKQTFGALVKLQNFVLNLPTSATSTENPSTTKVPVPAKTIDIDDVLEVAEPDPVKANSVVVNAPVTTFQDVLQSEDDAQQALLKYIGKINTITSKLKTFKTTTNVDDKTRNAIVSAYKEVKQLDTQLKSFFSTQNKTQVAQKLNKQFQEFQQIKKSELDKNSRLEQLQNRDDVYESKTRRPALHLYDEDDDTQEQQQLQKAAPKAVLSHADLNTINVEYAIAEETLRETTALESDFRELHSMMHDFKSLVHEQDGNINTIGQNIEDSMHNVSRGTDDIRTAKRYMNFGLK